MNARSFDATLTCDSIRVYAARNPEIARAARKVDDVIGWTVRVRTSPTTVVEGTITAIEPLTMGKWRGRTGILDTLYRVTLACGPARFPREFVLKRFHAEPPMEATR